MVKVSFCHINGLDEKKNMIANFNIKEIRVAQNGKTKLFSSNSKRVWRPIVFHVFD